MGSKLVVDSVIKFSNYVETPPFGVQNLMLDLFGGYSMSNIEPPDFNFNRAWTKARLKTFAIMLPITILAIIIVLKTRISEILHIPELTLFLSVIIGLSLIAGFLNDIFYKQYQIDEVREKELQSPVELSSFNLNRAWTKARLKTFAIMLPIYILSIIIVLKTRISEILHIPELTLFLSVIIGLSLIDGILNDVFYKKYKKRMREKIGVGRNKDV